MQVHPALQPTITADHTAGRSLPLNYLETFLSQNHSKIHFQAWSYLYFVRFRVNGLSLDYFLIVDMICLVVQ